MIPIPAIDLKGGECVRLKQGRMQDATVFSSDPVAVAGQWVAAGCERLHLVDLDAAFAGEPVNHAVIREIVRHYPDTPVQIGGGIRTLAIAEQYLQLGVRYLIIGTQAVKQPEFVGTLTRQFPDHIMVGIDAKDGLVATDGWANTSAVLATDLAQQFADTGVSAIVYTDIAKDGMMQGVNLEQTVALARAVSIPIIASGGVASLADIKALCQTETPIFGAIIGRALYDGAIDLAEACQAAKHWQSELNR